MKKNRRTVIAAIFIAFSLILVIVLSFLSKRVKPVPAGTVGNTAGNANNNGMFCEYNGVVYFSNPYDGGSLYSMLPDETQLKKIKSGNVSNINAGGRYLFYYQQGSGGGIAADQQAVMGLQCVDHRGGKAGIPCPVQIRLKLSL